jgi:polysaccharide biosynthesis protein PslG
MDNLKRKDGTPTQGAPTGFDFALDNTEQEQADWIVQGFQIMKKSGYVRFGIVFNLDYIQKIGDEPDAPAANVAPYSITRRDGSPRPAFEAIKAMPR